jgi:hypothetical protein
LIVDGVPLVGDACSVVSHTPFNTTCSCLVQPNGRRLEGEVGTVEVTTMLTSSYQGAADTVMETENVSVDRLKHVMAVFSMFAVL